MLCVFTGPILSWSQAQLSIVMGGKKDSFLLRWHLFSSTGSRRHWSGVWWSGYECLASVGITAAAVSRAVTPRIDILYIYKIIISSFLQLQLAASVNISFLSDWSSSMQEEIDFGLIQHFKTSISVKQTYSHALFVTLFGLADAASYRLTNWWTD